MHNKLVLAVATLLSVALIRVEYLSSQHAGGLKSQPLFLTPPEKTLSERAAAVDAVLLVKITAGPTMRAIDMRATLQARNPDLLLTDEILVPVTEYSADVLEVVKERQPGITGANVRFGMFGGEAMWAGRKVVATKRTADLKRDASYLLFVTYSHEFEQLMFVDDDVFLLEGPHVTANRYASSNEYGRRLVGLSPGEAMELLRQEVAERKEAPPDQ